METKMFLEIEVLIANQHPWATQVAVKHKINPRDHSVKLYQEMAKFLKRKRKNSRGFTLLEVTTVLTILGILSLYALPSIANSIRMIKKVSANLNASVKAATVLKVQLDQYAASNPARAVYLDDTCKSVDGSYWGKQQDMETAKIFTNPECSTSVGTLNTTNNSTFFNDPSNSLWVISSSGSGLRIVVINFNIFKEE